MDSILTAYAAKLEWGCLRAGKLVPVGDVYNIHSRIELKSLRLVQLILEADRGWLVALGHNNCSADRCFLDSILTA